MSSNILGSNLHVKPKTRHINLDRKKNLFYENTFSSALQKNFKDDFKLGEAALKKNYERVETNDTLNARLF